MCARLLACPLCSQPGFSTLDALRAGLVSVATRPLVCPICYEILIGIDKLTIHLFGHTIDSNVIGCAITEQSKVVNVNRATVQSWKEPKEQNIGPAAISTDRVVKYEIQAIPKISIASQKVGCLQSISGIGNNSSVDELRSCSQNRGSTEESQSRVIFVQNLSEPQQVCAMNLTSEQILGQNLSVMGQPPRSSILEVARKAMNEVEAKLDSQEQPREREAVILEEVNDISKFCAPNNIPEQPVSQAIPSVEQANVPHFQNSWEESISHDSCTASPSKLDCPIKENDDRPILRVPVSSVEISQSLQESQEDNLPVNNSVAEKEVPQMTQQNPDRPTMLPQLKAFRTIAAKEKTERCNICGFHFSDPNILVLHKQLVHMIDTKNLNGKPEDFLKNYPCHLCSKVFKQRGSLMVHMRVAHIGYNLGPLARNAEPALTFNENGYNCPTCGKNFKKEQHVTQHLKTHEGKQWRCDVCNKMFTTKYFLKKHKRLHSGEMPYKCNICEKTFTFQQSYHKHRLYHKDDKPHACGTCGRSFKELSTLHNHERIHTGEKPFECETCGKRFRQRVSYLVHRRIHTGVMPYKCTACGKSFRYKVSQRTHKCSVQPPGTVVRQSVNLVERLIQVSQKGTNTDTSNEREPSTITQDQQQVSSIVAAEDNKFVLIVNSQGQHVLTRQSDIEPLDSTSEEQNADLAKTDRANEEFIRNLWGHDISSDATLKESMEISTKECAKNGERHSGDDNDFLSMVMSPMRNEVYSPAIEMEHLRLSSPGNHDNLAETNDSYGQSSHHFANAVDNLELHDHFPENRGSVGAELHTINEESLKQLIYGNDMRQSNG